MLVFNPLLSVLWSVVIYILLTLSLRIIKLFFSCLVHVSVFSILFLPYSSLLTQPHHVVLLIFLIFESGHQSVAWCGMQKFRKKGH